MGTITLKGVFALLFISLLVPNFSPHCAAGERRSCMNELVTTEGILMEEKDTSGIFHSEEEVQGWNAVQQQARKLMRVQTNDYYSYNPRPAMAKPRFKLIPN